MVKEGGYPYDLAQGELDAFIKGCASSSIQLKPIHLPPKDQSATTSVITLPGTGIPTPQNTTTPSSTELPVTVTTSVRVTSTLDQRTTATSTSQLALVQTTTQPTTSGTTATTTIGAEVSDSETPGTGANSTDGGADNSVLNGNGALGASALFHAHGLRVSLALWAPVVLALTTL